MFAMDIEFKIDSTNQLAIKQARPWVSYVPTAENPAISDNCDFVLYPNPADNRIKINCADCGLITVRVSDMKGSVIMKKSYVQVGNSDAELDIEYLQNGTYFLSGYIGDSLCKTLTFIKH